MLLSLTRELFILGDVEPVWPLDLDTVNSFPFDTILEHPTQNQLPMGEVLVIKSAPRQKAKLPCSALAVSKQGEFNEARFVRFTVRRV